LRMMSALSLSVAVTQLAAVRVRKRPLRNAW
jgi:hypothetical protein